MWKKIFEWIKSGLLKAWMFIKSINLWALLDSDEFVFLFPLTVFAVLFAFNYSNPLTWVVLGLWVLVVYRRMI